jgi:hypothetical protein
MLVFEVLEFAEKVEEDQDYMKIGILNLIYLGKTNALVSLPIVFLTSTSLRRLFNLLLDLRVFVL